MIKLLFVSRSQLKRIGVVTHYKRVVHVAHTTSVVHTFCHLPCLHVGMMRYNHTRWFLARGVVKLLPDSCSAYSP